MKRKAVSAIRLRYLADVPWLHDCCESPCRQCDSRALIVDYLSLREKVKEFIPRLKHWIEEVGKHPHGDHDAEANWLDERMAELEEMVADE